MPAAYLPAAHLSVWHLACGAFSPGIPETYKQEDRTMDFKRAVYGDRDADTVLVQMVDDHDLELIEREAALIRELSGGQPFRLETLKVNSWNRDLSPWKAPAVFGNEDFGEGAADTLEYVLREIEPGKRTIIGGYSLAALFALWAVYRTERFDGAAAASPSLWFPGFTDYMRDNAIRTGTVYLSLGDREEKTRNPVMAGVGNAARAALEILKANGADCTLEWNKGNHFKDADLRTAKAFAWVMNRFPQGGTPV